MLLYIIPVLLVYGGWIPRHFRFYMLVSVSGLAAFVAYLRGYWTDALGLRPSPPGALILWSTIPLAALVLAWAYHLPHRLASTEHLGFYFFFVFVSAPVQEFLYRSFLFATLESTVCFSGVTKVLISASLFAFMHVIYRDAVTVLLTLLVGLLWGSIFCYKRSLPAVAASHAIVGVIAIYLGVV